MNRLRRLLGIKTDDEVRAEVNGEPTIQNARRALRRADGILEEYERLESQRTENPRPVRRWRM